MLRCAWIVWLCCLLGCAAQQSSAGAEAGWAGLDAPASAAEVETDGEASDSMRALAANPAAAPAPAEQEPAARGDAPARQVIYSAALSLVVVSRADAARKVQAFAEEAGGHLQRSDARSITVRVPSAKFEATLDRIATLGELVERSVEASDVTEQMLDLGLRLDNARKTRDRLVEHLARSQRIEDTLKIEAELARVSGEIEQIEGRLRYLSAQVAMSTIRVDLANASRDERPRAGLGLPFEWVGNLGAGLVAGDVRNRVRTPGIFARGPRFDPPREFIRYWSSKDHVEALNAEGVRLEVRKHANHDEGSLAFWTKLARKALVEGRGVHLSDESELGDDRAVLRGTREVAGELNGYVLVLARTRDHLYTFEAWGPESLVAPLVPELLASAKSLRR